jgi:hypothetical protein
MNRIKQLAGTLMIFTGIAILSCETVEEPFIESNPYTGVYDSDLPIRKILIEDFTGFGCVNCPRANEMIHTLKNTYGAHVVAIAVHSGFFAQPFAPGDPDYRTEVGFTLGGDGIAHDGFFHIADQPIGVVNRIKDPVSGEYKVSYQNWSKRIVDILKVNKFADIGIEITNSLDGLNLTTTITAKTVNPISDLTKIAVYIIEDHVIGKQKDGSVVIPDYEHMHMLRAGVIASDPTWGETFSNNSIPAGNQITKNYSFALSENWNPANCSVVAFIYYSNTLEVIQAEEVPITD